MLGTVDDGYWGALNFGLAEGPYASSADASAYLPPRDERQPRKLLGALVVGTELAVTAGKGLIGSRRAI